MIHPIIFHTGLTGDLLDIRLNTINDSELRVHPLVSITTFYAQIFDTPEEVIYVPLCA